MWGRSAMGLQQMGVAAAVLSRGLDVARASKDDSWEAYLCYQLAVARILGGSAPAAAATAGGAAGAAADTADAADAAATFDASEVLELQRRGDAALESVARWWPSGWADLRPEGEPDRSVLAQRLIPLVEERGGARVEAGARLPALQGVLYVTRAPTTLPPGALDSLGAGGEGLGRGVGVAEGEEGESEEQEHVVQV